MSTYPTQTSPEKSPKKGLLFIILSLFKLPNVFFILVLWYCLLKTLGYLGVSLAALNKVSLALILTTCLGGFGYLVASNKMRLWHPITWFLLTSALYYGYGPLLYYFGSSETISFVDNFYPVNDDALFLVNSVVIVGVATVIFFYLILSSIAPIQKHFPTANLSNKLKPSDARKLWVVACFLMIVGLPVKLFFTFPYSIGLLHWALPGSIKNIENFSVLALIPLYLIKNISLKYKQTFYLLAAFSVITSLATLSKLAVLIVLFAIFLAAVLKGVSLFRLGLSGVIILFFYAAFLSPMVTYGRAVFNVAGIQSLTDVNRLSEDIWQDKSSDYLADILPGVQGGWARLNYANAQAFAIKRYDSGQSGNSIDDLLWVIVPRELYPDKPNTSRHGTEFNNLVDGNPYSSSAPGMIAEGYWNVGWYGVVFVSFIMAIFYYGWEKYINYQIISTQFQFLPVMFMGLLPALTQDSWFVIGTLGMLPIAIATHWLIRLSFRPFK